MSTEAMIASAPEGVQVEVFHPAQLTSGLPDGYDRTIIGATEELGPKLYLDALARRGSYLMWLRSVQPPSVWPLLDAARGVSWPSAAMARWHHWDRPYLDCPAPIDPDEVQPGYKEDFALWAARNHPQKGLMNARLVAYQRDWKLVEMTDAPRAEVLAMMARARYFIHLPNSPDPCPRTVIEAELANCRIIVNSNVGRVAHQGPGLADYLRNIPWRFWRWVLENG